MLKPIPNFPDYFASEDGRIFSLKKRPHNKRDAIPELKELKYKTRKSPPYKFVCPCIHGKIYTRFVHQLILETFVGHRPKGMWACHGVRGKLDNSVDNLYWATPKQNNGADKARDGTDYRGIDHHSARLTNRDVYFIRYAHEEGISYAKLANMFNISPTEACRIGRCLRWQHL